MAQLIVRRLEDEVKTQLQRRAARHGRSMEEEVRDILRNAVKEQDAASGELGSEKDIRERRGQKVKPASFDR